MDCKDLMVGDFVKHNGVTKIVDAVYLCSVSVHDPSEPWGVALSKLVHVDDIEPIELTEGILVKLGFSKEYGERELEYDLKDFPITIVFDKYKKEWYAGTYMCGRESDWVERQFDCQFLHQLQHLYRFLNRPNLEASKTMREKDGIDQAFTDMMLKGGQDGNT